MKLLMGKMLLMSVIGMMGSPMMGHSTKSGPDLSQGCTESQRRMFYQPPTLSKRQKAKLKKSK